jgi:hypothetical protein
MNDLLTLKAELERKLKAINDVLELLASEGKPSAQKPRHTRTENNVASNGHSASNYITRADIREVIAGLKGEFAANEAEAEVIKAHPNKELRKTDVPNVLFALRKKGALEIKSKERNGRKGFTYEYVFK